MIKDNFNIVVIGLGYVGLPLAIEFGKKYPTIGIDNNFKRIEELKEGVDKTLEVTSEDIKGSTFLKFQTDYAKSNKKTVFIVTVPTPIDKSKRPDLSPLISASKFVGERLKKDDIIVYESTVFPGCTEEDCVPILEKNSGLKYNTDFYCGYSPERINPGDKVHTVTKIRKVTAGSTPEIADFVNNLYASIIEAGTFKAASIKVAEAAKVIENCQRDINIAFVNELALIFNLLEIDTKAVLEAASTKWNFLPFQPGLVGGHCIGVDPYYLTHKAESIGYNPQVILAGRRINDAMGKHVAIETIKLLIKNNISIKQSKILVLGITFKENCPDIRNSKVIDIIDELKDYEISFDLHDPWANTQEVEKEYNITLTDQLNFEEYAAIIVAVNHQEFATENFVQQLSNYTGIIYDVKGSIDSSISTKRL